MSIKTKKLAQWLDDQMKLDEWLPGLVGKIAEMSDGYIAGFLCDFLSNRIPDQYHDEVNEFIDSVISKDYERLKSVSSDRIVAIVKTPFGDEAERIVAYHFLSIIFELLELEKGKILIAKSKSVGGGGSGDDPDD